MLWSVFPFAAAALALDNTTYSCNWQNPTGPMCVVDPHGTYNATGCGAICKGATYAVCKDFQCVPCTAGSPNCTEAAHCVSEGPKANCVDTRTYMCDWQNPSGPQCKVDPSGEGTNATACAAKCTPAALYKCVDKKCVACSTAKPEGCEQKFNCDHNCTGGTPTPAPPPAPTPAPGPDAKYLCNWQNPSGPKCVVDPSGAGSNATACAAKCTPAPLFKCVDKQCQACSSTAPEGCVQKFNCDQNCTAPSVPTPAPGPDTNHYECSFATGQPVCIVQTDGVWANKTSCQAICS
jgi:hypothetical protein